MKDQIHENEKIINKLFKNIGITLEKDTPKRYLSMIMELTTFQNITNKEIAKKYNKTFEFKNSNFKEEYPLSNIVYLNNIRTFSLCKHHIALIYDMEVSVAYFPKNKIIGLSKIPRIADSVCKRLTLQEEITDDIFKILKIILETDDIAINIKAKHSCVTARGIKNHSTKTITFKYGGIFLKEKSFLEFLKK